MTKFASILSGRSVLLLIASLITIYSCNNTREREDGEEGEKDMYDEAAAAQQFEFERTKDPALGYVPKERLQAAYEYAEYSKQLALRSRITSGSWVERGPTADVVGTGNGNTRDGVNPVAAGRMRAIWVDLTDGTGNTVWVGGVAGGLWKTTNFKTSPCTWTPVNDYFTNMAISSICQDPSNTNIMYFCTGEAFFNFDAVRGIGVFKSTDNGANWTALGSTSTYTNCSKILCDASGNIYLGAVGTGLLRSTAASGGAAWTIITPTGLSSRVADFEISSTGRFHLSTGLNSTASGGYRYTDVPATVTSGSPNWKTSTTPFPFPSGSNVRAELACSGNTLYVLPSNNSAEVTTIYKSTDGGDTWAATGSTPSFTSGQAWYCLGVDIDPSNANNVVIGSLDCYKSTNGGTNWTQISDWATGSTGKYVHADQQIIKWHASNELLIGTDGGIFYSSDGGTTISDRNSGLRIKQFFSCDYHPTLTDYFLAGAQDNGCHKFTSPGMNTTTEITGGDGGFVHIDQDQSTYQFASYVRNRYKRSTDNWSSVAAVNFFRGSSGTGGSDFGQFINPTDYDNTANIMYCGSSSGEFFRWSTAQTTAAGSYYSYDGFPAGADTVLVSNMTGSVTSVTVSPYTSNRIYLGTNASKLMVIDNAHTFTSNTAGTNISGASFPAGATISNIAVGSNDNNLIATFSNYGVSNVWVSTNGGTGWTAIDGNLPDMPVRWALFDPTSDTKAYIATETGVWSTTAINGGATVWVASPFFPTVRTDMLKYRASDQTLLAATHGRGLWTQSLGSVLPVNNFVLRGKWKTNSTVELAWDYTNTTAASAFEVESSTNGTYFSKTGTSQINTSYVDQPSSTDIYYRVKGKNILGNISYSNVIHLKKGVDTKDISAIKLFPNPVKTTVKISFAASGNGLVHYQVTSSTGQVCWKKDETISLTGEYIREWNLQNLKPGTYLFTIAYNNKKITQKFVKQ
jgi:hypothetical protein